MRKSVPKYTLPRSKGMTKGLLRGGGTVGTHAVEIVRVRSSDWLPTLTGDSLAWYLNVADADVCKLYSEWGKVSLVGHSAGGWLARLLLGSQPYAGTPLPLSKALCWVSNPMLVPPQQPFRV
jgi:pimeloyl-ACP methyl ester carboxylesterase